MIYDKVRKTVFSNKVVQAEKDCESKYILTLDQGHTPFQPRININVLGSFMAFSSLK